MTLPDTPAIHLLIEPEAPPSLIEAFLLGSEEEGVPVRVEMRVGGADELAMSAAETSALFAGAAIDRSGTLAVHEQRLGGEGPIYTIVAATPVQSRVAGVCAARLVRSRPLPEVVVRDILKSV